MQADRYSKFCRACGSPTAQRLPDDGDTKLRTVCTQCATVHYVNPLNVVGTIPIWLGGIEPQVLLCKRDIEPRKGKWTLPAGFMEMNESAADGAARETVEEAGAQFTMGSLFTLISVTHVGQVHFFTGPRSPATNSTRVSNLKKSSCSQKERYPGTNWRLGRLKTHWPCTSKPSMRHPPMTFMSW